MPKRVKLGVDGTFVERPHLEEQGHPEISYDSSRGILLSGYPLIDEWYHKVMSMEPGAVWWRGRNFHYTLQDVLGNSVTYVNGGYSDLPDLYGGQLTITAPVFGGSAAYFMDRFGQEYLALSVVASGSVFPIDASYFEGYVAHVTSIFPPQGDPYLSESDLYGLLKGWGFCLSGQVTAMLGISVGGCVNSSAFAFYSMGYDLGVSAQATIYTVPMGKDPSWGWDWAIQEQRNGVYMEDLSSITEVPFSECNVYLPLPLR